MTIAHRSRPLRIAVLEADHPLDRTADKFGTYGGVFSSLLNKAAYALSWDPEKDLYITKWDVERLQLFPPSLDDLDAILVTGSRKLHPEARVTECTWLIDGRCERV